jgi:fatty acid desaturase
VSVTTAPPTLTIPRARQLARDDDLNRLHPVRATVHLVAQVALVGAVTLVAARTAHVLPVRLAAWALNAVLLAGLGGMLHDALHRLVYARRGTNDAVATLVAGAMLFPYGIYQQFHLGHHADFATEDDPEGTPLRFGSRLEYVGSMLIGTPIFLGILWWNTAKVFLGLGTPAWIRRPDRVRRSMLALLAVMAVGALATARWWWLLGAGFLPGLAGTYLVVLGVLLLPEHYGAEEGQTVVEQTTTTTSTGFLTWAFWGANHHTAHHLVATVPGPSLPRLTERIAGDVPAHRRSRGYLGWHLALFRSLPWLPVRSERAVAP